MLVFTHKDKYLIQIELTKLIELVQDKISDYYMKYNSYPKYLKMPLWLSHSLKRTSNENIELINYNTDRLTFYNLIVCETVSITQPQEMEVF